MPNKKRNIKINLIREMEEKQLKKKYIDEKDYLILHYLNTISKYINTSIFHKTDCCIWNGYITNDGIEYVNFYHNGKKTNLHRLLYKNFIGNLYDNNYLKYNCCNAGKCININHIEIKYIKPIKSVTPKKSYNNKVNKPSTFIVDFL